MATDWLAIRNEYVTLGKSVSELANSHGIKRAAVASRCCREKWEEQRRQFEDSLKMECIQQTAQTIGAAEADRLTRLAERGDRLGRLCDLWMDRAEEKGAKPQDIKAVADTLLKLSELNRVAEPEDKEIVIKFERPEWAE